MTNEWIMEMLDDLRNFARLNGLPGLAVELDQTLAVAFRELGRPVAQAHHKTAALPPESIERH